MKYLRLLAISWLINFAGYGQFQVPQVIIDAEGHSGVIKALQFTPDGSKLISFSDDKTIKVWDVETGELVQTLRGPAMIGPMGMVNSGAVHPNGEVMASGGYFGPETGDDPQLTGRIFLWDVRTGKIIQQVIGPDNSVVSLDFSANGEWLVCGTTSNEIGLWNLEKLNAGVKLSGHTKPVYVTRFSPDSKYLITGGYDKKLIRWDISSIVSGKQPVYTLMEGHSEEVRAGAFTPDGRFFISGGYDNQLIVWNQTGKIERYLESIKDPNYPDYSALGDIHSLAITKDGKYVLAGTILTSGQNVQIIDFQTGKVVRHFDKHDNTVTAITTYGDEWVASAGGENRDIYLWNVKTGSVKQHFASRGSRIYSVAAGPNGEIGFSTLKRATYQFNSIGTINNSFSLNALKLTALSGEQGSSFQGAMKDFGGTTATKENDYSLRLSNGSSIHLDPNNEGAIMAYSFTPGGNIAVAGTFRTKLFDLKGKRIQEFLGHTAMVTSLCISKDRKFLISGSSDQTIRLWDLAEKPTPAATFLEFKKMLINKLGSEENLNKVVQEKNINLNQLYLDTYEPFTTPFLNLFLTQDGEWVLWRGDNFYAASPKGSAYVGFHINQKIDQEARFIPFEQYDLQYNRPDKILEALKVPDPKLREAFYRAWQKRMEKNHVAADTTPNPDKIPTLELKTNSQVTDSNKVRVKFNANDFEYGLDRLNISINNVPVFGTQGQDLTMGNKDKAPTTLIYSINTPILPGKNKIQISVQNRIGLESEKQTITVISKEKPHKPNLYVITIGTSNYQDKRFNLSLAAKDAQDIAKQWNNRQDLFEKVYTHAYTNEQVTKENLTNIRKILDNATIEDVVIVFVAGHGMLDAKLDYYFGTYDIDFSNPAARGFSYQDLDKLLDGIKPIRKLLLIDTCHSGELDKEEVTKIQATPAEIGKVKFRSNGTAITTKAAFGGENTSVLLGQLFADLRRGTGATVVAAAGGAEFALESSEWNNGLFTYAFLNGLTQKAADQNHDGMVMLSELKAYIQKTVSELSQGKQSPVSRQENPTVDIRLW